MTILFIILIIIASVVLGFIVLVQNPKGGGLAGSFAGLSNQFMGVKQTTDVLEKGTWIFAAIIGVLCLASTFFISGSAGSAHIPETSNPTQQSSGFPAGNPNQGK
ncbi:MAG: preprotein translocase subunit SecG [Bacteroidetes bacterium]|jgi:preprotein translocase subunit SecG|nr:MAG: preprotein translocase subunit SecG [Bacteroidota bacterium]